MCDELRSRQATVSNHGANEKGTSALVTHTVSTVCAKRWYLCQKSSHLISLTLCMYIYSKRLIVYCISWWSTFKPLRSFAAQVYISNSMYCMLPGYQTHDLTLPNEPQDHKQRLVGVMSSSDCEKDGQQMSLPYVLNKMKPKLVGHIGNTGARGCSVSAFWSQSMRSKQKVLRVRSEWTLFG